VRSLCSLISCVSVVVLTAIFCSTSALVMLSLPPPPPLPLVPGFVFSVASFCWPPTMFCRRGHHGSFCSVFSCLNTSSSHVSSSPSFRFVSFRLDCCRPLDLKKLQAELAEEASHAVKEVSKNGPFEPFIYKNEHFTKTGSGQT
jgi:hypothetical protein